MLNRPSQAARRASPAASNREGPGASTPASTWCPGPSNLKEAVPLYMERTTEQQMQPSQQAGAEVGRTNPGKALGWATFGLTATCAVGGTVIALAVSPPVGLAVLAVAAAPVITIQIIRR